MRSERGVTLAELLIGFALFAIVGVFLAFAFSSATDVWRGVSGDTDAQTTINKARFHLSNDLRRTSFATVSIGRGTHSLGPTDSDVVWFLSAVDPATGAFLRKSDGTPFWQKNILYYAAVPNNHTLLYGFACTGGPDTEGYDEHCPHKILIRKVIDKDTATDPNDETTEETLLLPSDISTYLTRTDQLDSSAMNSEPGVSEHKIVTTGILGFRADKSPDPRWPDEVQVRLQSTALLSAQRELSIGNTPLSETRFTLDVTLPLYPNMP